MGVGQMSSASGDAKKAKKEQGEETREIAAKSSTGKSAPSSPCFGTRVMPPCVRGPVGLGCYLNLDPSVIFFVNVNCVELYMLLIALLMILTKCHGEFQAQALAVLIYCELQLGNPELWLCNLISNPVPVG